MDDNSWIDFSDNASISIGKNSKFFDAKITIMSGGNLIVGDYCEIRGRIIIRENCTIEIGNSLICNSPITIHMAENASIKIGNDCLFSNVQIFNSDMHSIFLEETGERINLPKDVFISNRVWIATNALILKGTYLSEDTVIGAGAVVSGKFDKQTIIAGNPAKVVKSGIVWSRALLDKRGIVFDDDFSPSIFREAATQFDHKKVIELSCKYFKHWPQMDKSNYYIFYYLSRSILLSHFYEKFVGDFKNGKEVIDINQISDSLYMCYEVSGKNNYSCGAYTYLSLKISANNEKANKLKDEILPKWKYISDLRYCAKWTIEDQISE